MAGEGGFKGIVNSFNPRFYKHIAPQSFGKSFTYLLFMVLVVSLLLSAKYLLELRKGIADFTDLAFRNLEETLVSGFPEIKIEKGQVSSTVKQPFLVKKGDFAFVLDTTGQVTSLNEYKNGILVTANKLITKTTKSGGASAEVNEVDLAKMRVDLLMLKPGDKQKGELVSLTINNKVFSVTKDNVNALGKKIAFILSPFLLILIFVSLLLGKLIHIVFFSLISLLANAIAKAGLGYRSLLNIGTYAITLPTAVSTVMIVLFGTAKNGFLPALFLPYVVIYVAFLFLAVNHAKPGSGAQAPVNPS
ncbi:MAG TPA: DUF1189 family protein [Patescibacteria group bacterium]|nr:DUF1189 family protein [Patescibacteria group bacterium]